MPSHNKSSSPKSKGGKNNTRKDIDSAANKRRKGLTAAQKEFRAFQRNEQKARDKELRGLLKEIRGKGIYDPKANVITKSRRTRLNKIKNEYGELLNRKEFFFIQAPKAGRKRIKERAENLTLKTTRTGFFMPAEGHTKAEIKYDKKHNEYTVVRKGRTKRGPNAGRHYTNAMPLSDLDTLDNERDRIKRMADRLGPLKKNERIYFTVKEAGVEGMSMQTFSSVSQLMNYLDSYQKKSNYRIPLEKTQHIGFLRHVHVEKIKSSEAYKEKYDASHPKDYSATGKPKTRKIGGNKRGFNTRGSK